MKNQQQINSWSGVLLLPLLAPAIAVGMPTPDAVSQALAFIPTTQSFRLMANAFAGRTLYPDEVLSYACSWPGGWGSTPCCGGGCRGRRRSAELQSSRGPLGTRGGSASGAGRDVAARCPLPPRSSCFPGRCHRRDAGLAQCGAWQGREMRGDVGNPRMAPRPGARDDDLDPSPESSTSLLNPSTALHHRRSLRSTCQVTGCRAPFFEVHLDVSCPRPELNSQE